MNGTTGETLVSADTRAILGTSRALVSIIDSMAYGPMLSMLQRSFKISSYVDVSCLQPTTTWRTNEARSASERVRAGARTSVEFKSCRPNRVGL
jgi:hypothetical protein